MSKSNWGKGFAAGLISGIILVLFFVFWSVPEFQNPIKYISDNYTKPAYETQKPQNQDDSHFWISHFYGWVFSEDSLAQWLMAVFAMFATGASFYAVYLLDRTLNSTRKVEEITRKVGIAQTRAYLSVVGGNYTINHRGFSGWVDIVNNGQSPAIKPSLNIEIMLEAAWFGGSMIGNQPKWLTVDKITAKKTNISPKEVSRFYFVWTKDQIGQSNFDILNDERFNIVVDCNYSFETIYKGITDENSMQLSNYEGFVRVTDRSKIASGILHPRQIQK